MHGPACDGPLSTSGAPARLRLARRCEGRGPAGARSVAPPPGGMWTRELATSLITTEPRPLSRLSHVPCHDLATSL